MNFFVFVLCLSLVVGLLAWCARYLVEGGTPPFCVLPRRSPWQYRVREAQSGRFHCYRRYYLFGVWPVWGYFDYGGTAENAWRYCRDDGKRERQEARNRPRVMYIETRELGENK